jgi:antitoxin component YwqK of YwqJK toxin-antitoxin module/tetratricopeptide (TPR) repeat protein
MKQMLLVAAFLSVMIAAFAQKEQANPLVNSGDIFQNASALQDEEKYKAAVAEYMKVPASDTNYSDVMHDLILALYKDSSYTEAEKYAREALFLFPDRKNSWYGFLADIYDEQGLGQRALGVYDTVLQTNPNNYLIHFNKGISLLRQEKFPESQACFKRCITLNPYYSSAHYFLGRLVLAEGRLAQAMMSITTSLLVNPENRYTSKAVAMLGEMAEVNDDVTKALQKYKPSRTDDFEMLQDILVSKIALDMKYKSQSSLDDGIVKQLQVLMEKLEYNASDKGFWMQYYVPMFKEIWDKKEFEPFSYYIFSGLDIKKVKDYVKKEKKDVGIMNDRAIANLNSIRETQELDFTKRATAGTRYYVSDYKIKGKGEYGKNAKGEPIVVGSWEFYHDNGLLASKGTFGTDGERSGEWRFYYPSGLLKEVTEYKAGKANGKSEVYHDNGLIYRKVNYTNDEKTGEEHNWYYSSRQSSIINYAAGKKEGKALYYTIDGDLKTEAYFKNDEQNGMQTDFFANGVVSSKLNYIDGKEDGEYKSYYNNGKPETIGAYKLGKKVGEWKSWHKNGQVSAIENYAEGEKEGSSTNWYENGKVASQTTYRKDEVDGKKQDFDDDGLVFSESEFERGRLRDIKFFDKKNNVISNTTSRRGAAQIDFYLPDGSLSSDGYYSKDGLLEGVGRNYFSSGQKSTEANYVKGLLDGKRTLYFENGKVRQEGYFKANNADGYFVDYWLNGNVSVEGWYKDDEREGTVIDRNIFGSIFSKTYYLKGNVHGITSYYHPFGKLDYQLFYDGGWFNKMKQYDTTGKLISFCELNKGEGQMIFKHFNGKPYIENNYKYYKLNGPYQITNGDGSKSAKGFHKNGVDDSSYTAWHPNGKLRAEGKYKNGQKEGVWKTYWHDGKLSSVTPYVDGKIHGKNLQYNEDGTLDKEMDYKEGEFDGEFKMYSGNKELMLVYIYKKGRLKGYTYEGKDGKLIPMISLPKLAGKVVAYYKNGIKSAEVEFSNNVVNGVRNLFYSNGKPYVVNTREAGVDNGVKKVFYPNGKLMKEEYYIYDLLQGHVKYYDQLGNLLFDQEYHAGNLHGNSVWYAAGKPVATYWYYNGVLEEKNKRIALYGYRLKYMLSENRNWQA